MRTCRRGSAQGCKRRIYGRRNFRIDEDNGPTALTFRVELGYMAEFILPGSHQGLDGHCFE